MSSIILSNFLNQHRHFIKLRVQFHSIFFVHFHHRTFKNLSKTMPKVILVLMKRNQWQAILKFSVRSLTNNRFTLLLSLHTLIPFHSWKILILKKHRRNTVNIQIRSVRLILRLIPKELKLANPSAFPIGLNVSIIIKILAKTQVLLFSRLNLHVLVWHVGVRLAEDEPDLVSLVDDRFFFEVGVVLGFLEFEEGWFLAGVGEEGFFVVLFAFLLDELEFALEFVEEVVQEFVFVF